MITYAGEKLLLEDAERHFATWLERALPLADLRLFGDQPVALTEGRTGPRTDSSTAVGLPTANWSHLPSRLKLNTLWWPTGASRFALGLFLVGDASLTEIRSALSSTGSATLALSETEEGGREISTDMFMLPPRPAATVFDEDVEKLWILPLVDDRYHWQFKDAGDLDHCVATWDALFIHLGQRIGQQVGTDPIPSAYERPDPEEWTRPYENAAVLLDAAAWCVGQRIIRQLDGTVVAQKASTSKGTLAQNTQGGGLVGGQLITPVVPSDRDPMKTNTLAGTIWAGGLSNEYPAEPAAQIREHLRRPAAVRVVFRRGPCCDDVWAKTILAGEVLTGNAEDVSDGTTKTLFDTARAVSANCTGEPTNAGQLTTLATQIAQDYYAWLAPETYDMSWAGLKEWEPTGFDDAIWWHWGALQARDSKDPSGPNFGPEGGAPYAAYTRVTSLPANFGISELLHGIIGHTAESCDGEGFWARLVSWEECAPNRWRYKFCEVEPVLVDCSDSSSADGPAEYCCKREWRNVAGGRRGFALNTVEAHNSAAGMQGNGIDVDERVKPIPECDPSSSSSGSAASEAEEAQCECECRLLPAGVESGSCDVSCSSIDDQSCRGAIVRMYADDSDDPNACPGASSSSSSSGAAEEGVDYWFQFENQWEYCTNCNTEVQVVSDVYCSPDGSEIIVCVRNLTFDCRGHLIEVGPEVCPATSSSGSEGSS